MFSVTAMGNTNDNYRPLIFSGYSPIRLTGNNLAFSTAAGVCAAPFESIDSRFLALDDATLLPFIFRNYKPVARDGDYLIFRATADIPDAVRLRLIHEQTLRFDETVNLSAFKGMTLIMQVDMSPTLPGKLVKFVYQSPVLYLNMREGERVIRKRFVPSMAKGGFLFAPLLQNSNDVIKMYEGSGVSADSVSFSMSADARWQLSDTITFRLYNMEQDFVKN
jgi:hypothetical protein